VELAPVVQRLRASGSPRSAATSASTHLCQAALSRAAFTRDSFSSVGRSSS
jgi:hypothetical protein